MKARQILINFLKERWWRYALGIIILIITTIIASLLPKILGIITDGLDRGDMPRSEIIKNIGLMLLIAVSVFIFKFTWRYFLVGSARNVECYLRRRLFKHLQTLPVSFYNNNKTGDLVAHAINDIQAVRQTFGFGFVAIIDGIVINSAAIYFMARTINPILTIMALAPAPILVFVLFKLRLTIRKRFERVQKAFAEISEKVQENISGIRVVKAFAQENEEVGNFSIYNQKRVDTQMHLTKASAFLAPCTQICFGISFMFFIIYGSELVITGRITLGDYVAFNTYMMLIMQPITNIARIIEVWQRGIASIKRLDRIFTINSDVINKGDNDIESVRGRIDIIDLNFSYPGESKRTIKDSNIHIPEGRTLGILGRTGSGKTTLVNLLLKLFPVEDGHIFIDGTDINEIPIDKLRESVGYVPQDHFLFSTTIRENIQFFKPIYTDDDVEEAARVSGVYDNIQEFPNGFETTVGERGVTLSGGQKQRISIARAIIKDPSILILDDSLSAVDTKTEEEILGNIKNVLKNRTGILISHRISTVKNADEIIYMERGRVIERGSHDDLMVRKGPYYNLYQAQLAQNSDKEGVS